MELGGCCLTRYRALPPSLPSKADQIMSRYRPIAPKPMALTMPSIPDANRTVSSVVSFDTAGCRQVPDAGMTKRVRKRRGDSLTSSRASKKAATTSGRSDSSKERSGVSNGAAGSVYLGGAFAGIGRSPVDSFLAGGVFAANGLNSCVSILTVDSSEASVLGGASVVAATGAISTSGLIDSSRIMEQDAGFMKRAADSAPLSVLPERRMTTRSSGGFTEMIRGITRLSTTTDVRNLMHHFRSPVEMVQSIPTDFGREGFAVEAAPSFCADPIDGEDEVAPVEEQQEQDDDGSANLVTLPLLPDPPSRPNSSHSSVSTASSLTQADSKNSHGGGIRDVTFCCWSDELHVCSSDNYKYPNSSLCNIALIKQNYGNSRDPVLLMGDSGKVLWCNPAYVRALKDTMDRQASATPRVVPFIDPLGSPTQLGRLNLQLPGYDCSWATLWGFLKKFVVDAATEEPGAASPVEFPLKELNLNSFLDVCCRLGDGSHLFAKGDMLRESSDREASCASGVIVPQPVRLVGSNVSLGSVTDIQTEAQPVSESLELVKKQLEDGNSPAFITDSSNKVRWVNTAYKQMVGQPECPWLVSTVNATETAGILPSPRLTGEVLFTTSVEIPLSAPAFSGRANIQWTNTGERNCMTVPCDVCRLNSCSSSGKAMVLVWKFDIDASLRLTCGR